MADTKITALAAITTVDPANDVLPIVDVSDTSMAASGTTKKITTNQILGASGTATLASATITGDLTVDTSTLYVSSSADKVAIGTTSLSNEKLTVAGNISANAWLGRSNIAAPAGDCSIFRSADNTLGFGIASSTAMTLNSTGLGVGGSPAAAKIQAAASALAAVPAAGATGHMLAVGSTPYGLAAGALTNGNSYIQATRWDGTATNYDLMIQPNGGNVGIGVTPSATMKLDVQGQSIRLNSGSATGFALLRLGGTASDSFFGFAGLANDIVTGTSAGDTVIGSNKAGANLRFISGNGVLNATLDASGNLLVGTTSAGGNRLNVQTASGDCTALIKSQAANVGVTIDYVSNYGNFNFAKSGTAKWSLGILNDSASTPTFKLFNDAAVGVYVTYGGTSWTATSDERLKDIIEPISNAVAKVGSLRSVIGKFKSDSEGTRRSFLIAQDVQSALPEAVDASNPDRLGVAYSEVIPLLVAAIKELTARVQTLETR